MDLISFCALWTTGIVILLIWTPTQTSGQLWTLTNEAPAMEEGGRPKCHSLSGLSRNQKSPCQRYNDHMEFVNTGAQIGLQECKFQMQNSRWNCTTPPDSSPDKAVNVGSKEVAFSYAIAAAGVVHALARACKNGELGQCGCSKQPRPDGLAEDWKWGGCGDDTDYAYGFSHEFIDARERENSFQDRKVKSRTAMNIHNNEAGRMSVVRATRPTCKCHGVSGSCSLKTCWMQVPAFRQIGDKLKARYMDAMEMRSTNRGQIRPRLASTRPPRITDLVFLDSSPDYCNPNREMGVLGTSGRACKMDSSGTDGCGLMCCGRGYTTREVEIVEKCRCKFQWCCYVRCEECRKRVLKHICN